MPSFNFLGGFRNAEVVCRQRQQISDFVEHLIDSTIQRLHDNGCIEISELGEELVNKCDPFDLLEFNLQLKSRLLLSLRPTHLGQIASLYYIQTTTVAMFHKILSRESKSSLIDVIKLLCDCPEYNQLPVR